MNIVLFLGAGASVCLDKPTTVQFKARLFDKYAVKDNTLLHMLLNISKFPDIEYVLKCLDEWKKFDNSFAADFIKEFENPSFSDAINELYGSDLKITQIISDIQNISDQIRSDIFTTYAWNTSVEANNTLDQVFKPLLDHIKNNSDSVRIFTTNYDLAIEKYCERNDIHLIDGFEPKPSTGMSTWNGDNFTYNNSNTPKIYLCKLHGSLNWKKYESNSIEKSRDETESNGKDNPNVFILPVLDPKDQQDAIPFKQLFDNFDEHMKNADVCICIGYSFRDTPVNDIFKKNFKHLKLFTSISTTSILDFYHNFLQIDNEDNPEIKNINYGENQTIVADELNNINGSAIIELYNINFDVTEIAGIIAKLNSAHEHFYALSKLTDSTDNANNS